MNTQVKALMQHCKNVYALRGICANEAFVAKQLMYIDWADRITIRRITPEQNQALSLSDVPEGGIR